MCCIFLRRNTAGGLGTGARGQERPAPEREPALRNDWSGPRPSLPSGRRWDDADSLRSGLSNRWRYYRRNKDADQWLCCNSCILTIKLIKANQRLVSAGGKTAASAPSSITLLSFETFSTSTALIYRVPTPMLLDLQIETKYLKVVWFVESKGQGSRLLCFSSWHESYSATFFKQA